VRSGKSAVLTIRTLEWLRQRDADALTSICFHRVMAKGGHDIKAVENFAEAYNCELDIHEKERILIKDVFIHVRGRALDLILFYIAYSNYFGEPTDA
jgi:hypothetical protein